MAGRARWTAIAAAMMMVLVLVTACGSAPTAPVASQAKAGSAPATVAPTATTARPAAAPTPTTAFELREQGAPDESTRLDYRAGLDLRELYANIGKYKGWKLTYTGKVTFIQATADNLTEIQIMIDRPSYEQHTAQDFLIILTNVDCSGILTDDRIAVWGRPLDMTTIENADGGHVDQPELYGGFVQKLN